MDDPLLIAEYDKWHQQLWPEIKASILNAGVSSMQIYRYSNHLFMIMDVEPDFSFEKKAVMDAGNPIVQEWETLMWKYQQPVPGAKEGEKWTLMDNIFSLDKTHST